MNMNNQGGFIQIPILIAIIIAAASGGAYITYEIAKPSQDISKQAITTEETQILASLDDSPEVEEEQNTDKTASIRPSQEEGEKDQDEEIEKLKEKIDALERQSKTTTTDSQDEVNIDEDKLVELPNGAIVEMDASGNILRYITGSPTQPEENNDQKASDTEKNDKPLEILGPKIVTGITTGRLEWDTNKLSTSKVFISADNFPEKVFESESGLSTKHYVDLTGFYIKADYTYFYEIEAVDSKGDNFVKKSGSFKLLSRPYNDILSEIKISIEFNPDLSCEELFLSTDEFLVCLTYRAGL